MDEAEPAPHPVVVIVGWIEDALSVATLLGGLVLPPAVFAVLHRAAGRSKSDAVRRYGPWVLAWALPIALWSYLLVTPIPPGQDLVDGLVVVLVPVMVSFAPFGFARLAMKRSSVVYYFLVIPLVLLVWLVVLGVLLELGS